MIERIADDQLAELAKADTATGSWELIHSLARELLASRKLIGALQTEIVTLINEAKAMKSTGAGEQP